jgi:hypothetical protein
MNWRRPGRADGPGTCQARIKYPDQPGRRRNADPVFFVCDFPGSPFCYFQPISGNQSPIEGSQTTRRIRFLLSHNENYVNFKKTKVEQCQAIAYVASLLL